jgi:hypothetical protein
MGRKRISNPKHLTTIHVSQKSHDFIYSMRQGNEPLYRTVDRIFDDFFQAKDEARMFLATYQKSLEEKMILQKQLEAVKSQ